MKIDKFIRGIRFYTSKNVPTGRLTIKEAGAVKAGEKDVLAVLLEGSARHIRLDTEQATVLAAEFGVETDDWKGKSVKVGRGAGGKGIDIVPAL